MKKLNGVISAQQFDRETLEAVFLIADEMKKNPDPELLKGKIMGSLFYEPSTRTRWSFEIAMLKLGGLCISTESAGIFSSAAKGESLEDTIRVLSGYPIDLLTLRYNKKGGAERAEKFSRVPVINAGDGNGQHPTQALLDLYTIRQKYPKISGLKIAMMGDLANGRTVRSLCYFLAKHFPDNEIYFISPEAVKMQDDIKEYLDKHGAKWQELFEITPEIIAKMNVIYQTRIQKERFQENISLFEEVSKASEMFMIGEDFVEQMDKDGIILHPLPRINEIAYAVDKDPRACYFQQAWNGVYVRMALLKMILIGY
ncbi:MAG: aspartate carbamoyltransferase [Parcubacteria group bacterium]|jgi:aspartate carbamoyltransferase catalytic subunit